jgi:hypothetical protein
MTRRPSRQRLFASNVVKTAGVAGVSNGIQQGKITAPAEAEVQTLFEDRGLVYQTSGGKQEKLKSRGRKERG